MTETDVKVGALQKQIAHLDGITDDGWVLRWGDTPATTFELVCRKATAMQVQRLDALVTRGHNQAQERLLEPV